MLGKHTFVPVKLWIISSSIFPAMLANMVDCSFHLFVNWLRQKRAADKVWRVIFACHKAQLCLMGGTLTSDSCGIVTSPAQPGLAQPAALSPAQPSPASQPGTGEEMRDQPAAQQIEILRSHRSLRQTFYSSRRPSVLNIPPPCWCCSTAQFLISQQSPVSTSRP